MAPEFVYPVYNTRNCIHPLNFLLRSCPPMATTTPTATSLPPPPPPPPPSSMPTTTPTRRRRCASRPPRRTTGRMRSTCTQPPTRPRRPCPTRRSTTRPSSPRPTRMHSPARCRPARSSRAQTDGSSPPILRGDRTRRPSRCLPPPLLLRDTLSTRDGHMRSRRTGRASSPRRAHSSSSSSMRICRPLGIRTAARCCPCQVCLCRQTSVAEGCRKACTASHFLTHRTRIRVRVRIRRCSCTRRRIPGSRTHTPGRLRRPSPTPENSCRT